MIHSSPALGKLTVAHGEEAWHRSPWDWLFGVQGEARGKARYELQLSQGVKLPGGQRLAHPPAAALPAVSPTRLPPGGACSGATSCGTLPLDTAP